MTYTALNTRNALIAITVAFLSSAVLLAGTISAPLA